MRSFINDSFIIGGISGVLTLGIIQYFFIHVLGIPPVRETESPAKHVKVEYYLQISEDSIWIENAQSHRAYGGTYIDLDSLTLVDNL
jgi:hypothetical protein